MDYDYTELRDPAIGSRGRSTGTNWPARDSFVTRNGLPFSAETRTILPPRATRRFDVELGPRRAIFRMKPQRFDELFARIVDMAVQLCEAASADGLLVLLEGPTDWEQLKERGGNIKILVAAAANSLTPKNFSPRNCSKKLFTETQ